MHTTKIAQLTRRSAKMPLGYKLARRQPLPPVVNASAPALVCEIVRRAGVGEPLAAIAADLRSRGRL